MAKIVYKKGLEGQNKIDCIEGIEIEMMNGQCALIYPKYTDLPILYFKQYDDWKTKDMREIEALKEEDSKEVTDDLFALDSPAAKFVRQFKNDAFGHFSIPTLFTTMEIAYQMEDIDALAKTIEGADTLKKYGVVSSCSRYSHDSRWTVDVYTLFISNHALCSSVACVPTIVYKKPQTVYMVTSERAERGDPQNCIDDVQIFSDLKVAEIYADMRFRIVLNNFHTSKEKVRLFEEEKYLEKYGNGSLHANFIASSGEWDVWVTIEKKEIQ